MTRRYFSTLAPLAAALAGCARRPPFQVNDQCKFTLAIENHPPVAISAPEKIDDSRTQC